MNKSKIIKIVLVSAVIPVIVYIGLNIQKMIEINEASYIQVRIEKDETIYLGKVKKRIFKEYIKKHEISLKELNNPSHCSFDSNKQIKLLDRKETKKLLKDEKVKEVKEVNCNQTRDL